MTPDHMTSTYGVFHTIEEQRESGGGTIVLPESINHYTNPNPPFPESEARQALLHLLHIHILRSLYFAEEIALDNV